MSSALRIERAGERDAAVDGVRLAFDDEGAGIPLVCLHAIGHDARDFAALHARLKTPVRLVALDWPGHGRSGADREPVSAARYARLAEGFLAAQGLRDVVLLGNSIGAAVALRVAASPTAGERVRAVVACNPGGLEPVGAAARAVTGAMASFHARGAAGARWYPWAYGAYYRTVLQRSAARARRTEIVASGTRMAPLLAEAWRSFGGPDADQRGLAHATKQPVLFAWAVRDLLVSLSRARPALHQYPNARIERFAAGHAAFLETPEAFARALDRFLGEIGAVHPS